MASNRELNLLRIIGIRFLTVVEKSYKYRKGENKNESHEIKNGILCTNAWFLMYI